MRTQGALGTTWFCFLCRYTSKPIKYGFPGHLQYKFLFFSWVIEGIFFLLNNVKHKRQYLNCLCFLQSNKFILLDFIILSCSIQNLLEIFLHGSFLDNWYLYSNVMHWPHHLQFDGQEYPEYTAYTTPLFFHDDWLNLYLDYHRMHKDPDTYKETNEICCSDYRFVYMGAKGLSFISMNCLSWFLVMMGK